MTTAEQNARALALLQIAQARSAPSGLGGSITEEQYKMLLRELGVKPPIVPRTKIARGPRRGHQ